MVAPLIIAGAMAGMQMLEAKNKADALKRQADFRAQQQRFNAQLLEIQREDLLAKSFEDIDKRQRQVGQVLGAQKVALAAQGIDVEGEIGTALEHDERQLVIDDVQTIKNNAWRQSLGMQIQASDIRTQAQFTDIAGRAARRSTLVTGGAKAASTFAGGFK